MADKETVNEMANRGNEAMSRGSDLPWTLRAYAASRILSNWTNGTYKDLEWAEALALCIDKFAKDWVATNCPGRVREP